MSKRKKPSLIYALKFSCPYCGKTPLLSSKFSFSFANGCENCDYKFVRNESYYSGANQLICFPIAGTTGLILAALLYAYTEVSIYWIAGLSFVAMALGILIFWPLSLVLWLWLEHFFNPLNHEDKYEHKV